MVGETLQKGDIYACTRINFECYKQQAKEILKSRSKDCSKIERILNGLLVPVFIGIDKGKDFLNLRRYYGEINPESALNFLEDYSFCVAG